MALNTIEYATILQQELDKVIMEQLLTGWMEINAGMVRYNGGKEVKIPKLETTGLGNYNRSGEGDAYTKGKVTLEYETRTMTQDRGASFEIDAMDVDETNYVLTSSTIMGNFQETQVVPEIDAYRLSTVATYGLEADNYEDNYTPNPVDIVSKIKKGIASIRDKGYNGPLVCHITNEALLSVQENTLTRLQAQTFAGAGINTEVPMIDNVPLIPTPQNRMYSKIDLLDGKTGGQEQGGYKKAGDAVELNFIIVAKTTPKAITKQDVMRIFDPNTNQFANAWKMDYRRYHDVWVLDNKVGTIFVNTKGTYSKAMAKAGAKKK